MKSNPSIGQEHSNPVHLINEKDAKIKALQKEIGASKKEIGRLQKEVGRLRGTVKNQETLLRDINTAPHGPMPNEWQGKDLSRPWYRNLYTGQVTDRPLGRENSRSPNVLIQRDHPKWRHLFPERWVHVPTSQDETEPCVRGDQHRWSPTYQPYQQSVGMLPSPWPTERQIPVGPPVFALPAIMPQPPQPSDGHQGRRSSGQEPGSAQKLIPEEEELKGFDFTAEYSNVLDAVQVYCRTHVSESLRTVVELPYELRRAFEGFCAPAALPSLIATGKLALLVSRYLIEVATREALGIQVFRTWVLSKAPDEIMAARAGLAPGISVPKRAALYTVAAEGARESKSTPLRTHISSSSSSSAYSYICEADWKPHTVRYHAGCRQWVADKAAETSRALYTTLAPVLKADGGGADALRALWRRAFWLGVNMHTRACNYRFDFVPPGPSSFYNPATMCCEDGRLGPAALAKGDLRGTNESSFPPLLAHC